jgi:predicted nucleotidyltransferase
MYLDRILGSTTKLNALSVLISDPKKGFMEIELAKESGSPVSEVNRQMRDLVNSGLVLVQRVGRAKVYQINSKHFLYTHLRRLFRSLESVYREVAQKIVSRIVKHEPRAVILFGSLVTGKIRSDIVREPSDIDLVVVADKGDIEKIKDEMIQFINAEISVRYGVTVYPIVLSSEDYVKGLSGDQFIIDIHSKGELLYGEKPRRFG